MPPKPPSFRPAHTAFSMEWHRDKERKEFDKKRGSASARGYDSKWKKARTAYLAEHPLCAECAKSGRVAAASIVDHVVPHKGNMTLFWDISNWQPLCRTCHNRKTAREDSSFARPKKPRGG